jgi:MOSC domain-containing protein YiiM
MAGMEHATVEELEAGLAHIAQSPVGMGRVELIVRRPAVDQREVVDAAEVTVELGLVGDSWIDRPSRETPDHSPDPERQLNVMNARAAALIARSADRWPLAGDQLYVDLHLGTNELPPGTRLHIGEAIIEVTPPPHRGCAKFTQRFGLAAMRFVNSEVGREMNLRGINAKVIVPGTIRTGDAITAITPSCDAVDRAG